MQRTLKSDFDVANRRFRVGERKFHKRKSPLPRSVENQIPRNHELKRMPAKAREAKLKLPGVVDAASPVYSMLDWLGVKSVMDPAWGIRP